MVLGSGPPGGSWHRMDPNLRTLSLSAWMSLPGLDFNTWIARQSAVAENEMMAQEMKSSKKKLNSISKIYENNWWKCLSNFHNRYNTNNLLNSNFAQKSLHHDNAANEIETAKLSKNNSTAPINKSVPRRVLSVRRKVSRDVQTRALVYDVAQYYENYVKEMNLERYFHDGTLVTCVKPISSAANKRVRWLVRGIQSNGTMFAYCCQNVVLANGASDLANRLGVSGEGSNEWVKHDLPALESVLERIPDTMRSSEFHFELTH